MFIMFNMSAESDDVLSSDTVLCKIQLMWQQFVLEKRKNIFKKIRYL